MSVRLGAIPPHSWTVHIGSQAVMNMPRRHNAKRLDRRLTRLPLLFALCPADGLHQRVSPRPVRCTSRPGSIWPLIALRRGARASAVLPWADLAPAVLWRLWRARSPVAGDGLQTAAGGAARDRDGSC